MDTTGSRPDWHGPIVGLLYVTQFDQNPVEAVDRVRVLATETPVLGYPVVDLVAAIRAALGSGETLTGLAAGPQWPEDGFRGFLRDLLASLEG